MVHVPLVFVSEWHQFPLAPSLAGKKTWTAYVYMLLKSRVLPDFVPFSLCNTVPLLFVSELHEFPFAPCLTGRKTWWQLTSPCCWNLTHCLTCFLSASVTRKDLQFNTWTDPSFQQHYRFRPTSGSRSGKGFISFPSYFSSHTSKFVPLMWKSFFFLVTWLSWVQKRKFSVPALLIFRVKKFKSFTTVVLASRF